MNRCNSSVIATFLAALISAASAQDATERHIVVNGAEADEEFEEPGSYGQPQWAERSRASVTTKLYVLSPFEVFLGAVSESDFLAHKHFAGDLTQEIEIGLPYRIELDLENHLGLTSRRLAESEVSVGARYALAAWGKIPLNPTIAVAYQFGTGQQLAESFDHSIDQDQPDEYELRLLLGQEFIPHLQWAANIFFRHAVSAGLNREIGFTQDVAWLAIADKLELGAEMRYTNATRRGEKRGAANELVIGPSVNWKPNLHTVLSLAPLFGCTDDSPRVAILASVSLEFGGGESRTVRPGNR